MPRYAYKAVSDDGDVAEGEIEARDKMAAVELLRARGQLLIRADEIGLARERRNALGAGRWRRAVRDKDVALATRAMATLLESGLPVDRALALTAQLADRATMAELFEGLRERVRAGARLSDALAAHPEVFPPFYVGLVRAGEAGGALAEVTQRLADALERTRALKESVRSALTYPVIVLVVAAASILILLVAVIPEFRPLFEDTGSALPASTRIVLAASDAVREGWWAMLLGLLALLLGGRQLARQARLREPLDRLALRLPVAGPLWRKLDAARFTRTLGMLLANGVGPVQGLELAVRTVSNRATAMALADCAPRLRRGEGLGAPLAAAGVLPNVAGQMIELGEESGALETMLARAADYLDDEVREQVQRGLALLVPAVTIALGVLVATIVGSILSAILSSYRLPL